MAEEGPAGSPGILDSLNKELAEAGEFLIVHGLAFPDQARLVRADKDGMPITDGVFPESKEFLAGYWIVDVESPERAYAIAARASAAPGPGGTPLRELAGSMSRSCFGVAKESVVRLDDTCRLDTWHSNGWTT